MKQRLIVRTANRRLFIEELLVLGAKGATLAEDSVPLMTVPYCVEVEVEVERGKEYLSTHVVHAVPLPVELFTQAQMEEMVWEDFRVACAALDIRGRERAVMLAEYMRKSGDYIRNIR